MNTKLLISTIFFSIETNLNLPYELIATLATSMTRNQIPSPYGGKPPRSLSKSKGPRSSQSPAPTQTFDRTGSFATTNENMDFQMMDISVSVDIMEGLIMENVKVKGETPLGTMPINAVISCTKNVSRSRQIATHVPSLPLSIPSASLGDKKHDFLVRWPADFDPQGDALSTFKMSRLMKKDFSMQSHGPNLSSGYVAEEIELMIGLMRGSEMITVGKAILIITGNETEEMVIDLPISNDKNVVKNKGGDVASPVPLKKSGSKLSFSNKNSVKILKPKHFPSDKRRKFYITDSAMIRLHVQINPKNKMSESFDESGAYGTSHNIEDVTKYSSDYTPSEFASQKPSESTEYLSSEYSSEYSDIGESNSGSKEDHNAAPDSYIVRKSPSYRTYSRSPHKYHSNSPSPTDELERDFARVNMRDEEYRRAERHMNQPRHSSNPRPRSSSNGRAFGNEIPRYTQKDMYQQHVPELVQVGSRAQMRPPTHRSSTPQKSRGYDSHAYPQKPVVHDNSAYYDRSSSRNRDRHAMHYHDSHERHIPRTYSRGSHYEEYDHSPTYENQNHYKHRGDIGNKKNSSSKKNRSQRHHTKGDENDESPMTWLYDKFAGDKNIPGGADTVMTTKKSNTKKTSSYDTRRSSSNRRTMRV